MGWPDGWTIASSWGKGAAPVALRQHRAVDGLAGWLDGSDEVVQSLDTKRGGPDDNEAQAGHLIAYRKATKAHHSDDWERWEPASMSDTLDAEAMGAVQGTAILNSAPSDDPLLPLGLDSNRYRCCGNGVVSHVAEWLGRRLIDELQSVGVSA